MISQKLFYFLILLLPTQLGLHFWPDWASVFGIRVDYLAPTIYLTDLLVGGILISWWWEQKKFIIYLPALLRKALLAGNLKFTIVFVYLLVTSLFIAQNSGVAIYKLAKLVEFSLLGLYVYKNWKLVIGNWKFHTALSAAVAYSSLIAWSQFLLGHTIGGPFWLLGERTFDVNTPGIALVNIGGQEYLRPYATLPHPNVLAGFLLMGMILIKHSTMKPFNHLTIYLLLSALILTFSQATWIAGIIMLLLATVPFLRERLVVITRLTLVALIIISLVLPFIPRIGTASREVNQRLELAKAAGAEIRDYPLAGVGLNNFIVRLPESGEPSVSWWLQPVHNIFLLVLAETGIVGFGFLIWFLFILLKRLSIYPFNHSSILLAFLVILLTGAADHYWLTLQQGQLLLTIVFGLCLVKPDRIKRL